MNQRETHAKGIHSVYLALMILYVLFLALIVVLANLRIATWVFAASRLVPFGDKLCHMILMGIFSFLLNSALHCRSVSLMGMRCLIGSLIACPLVLAEELSQYWVTTRNLEGLDLFFNMIGIYLFGILAWQNVKIKQTLATVDSRGGKETVHGCVEY